MLPAGTRCPTSAPASSNCRSARSLPCMRQLSSSTWALPGAVQVSDRWHRDHLRKRRAEEPGVPLQQLLREIRELGYQGSSNLLVRYINQGSL